MKHLHSAIMVFLLLVLVTYRLTEIEIIGVNFSFLFCLRCWAELEKKENN
jgi:hypothetical protein